MSFEIIFDFLENPGKISLQFQIFSKIDFYAFLCYSSRTCTQISSLSLCMRLLVVSNRLPVACKYSPEGTSVSCAPTVGGLATAMLPILQHESGVWVGWAGVESQAQDQAQEHVRLSDALRECAPCTLKPVLLNRAEISLYYDGTRKRD